MSNGSPQTWKAGWTPVQEAVFRKWYAKWAERLKLNPDPDDPQHNYDYREAYIRGIEPTWQEEHGQYRWSDIGKSENYPQEEMDQKAFERRRINNGAKYY